MVRRSRPAWRVHRQHGSTGTARRCSDRFRRVSCGRRARSRLSSRSAQRTSMEVLSSLSTNGTAAASLMDTLHGPATTPLVVPLRCVMWRQRADHWLIKALNLRSQNRQRTWTHGSESDVRSNHARLIKLNFLLSFCLTLTVMIKLFALLQYIRPNKC